MANTITHRRSGTTSSVPTTGQLTDGEIAINYMDGRMFFRKNVSGTLSIMEVATLNGTQTLSNKTFTTPVLGVASGTSLALSGSLNMTANSAGGGQFLMVDSASGGQTWQIGPGAGTGSTNEIGIYNNTTATLLYKLGKTGNFWTAGGVQVSGSLGIGGAPTYPFDLQGNLNSGLVGRIANASTGGSSSSTFQIGAGGRYVNFTSVYTGQYLIENASGIVTRYMDYDTFYWRNSAGTSRMVMDSSANLYLYAAADGSLPHHIVNPSGMLRMSGYFTNSGAYIDSCTYSQSAYAPLSVNGSVLYLQGAGTNRMAMDGSNIYVYSPLIMNNNIALYQRNNTTAAYAVLYTNSGNDVQLDSGSANLHLNANRTGHAVYINYNNSSGVYIGGNGVTTSLIMNSAGLIQMGGTSSSYPAFRNNGGTMECVLADQSAYGSFTSANLTANGGRVYGTRFEQAGVVTLGTSGTVTPTWTSGNFFRCTTTGNVTLAIGTAPPCGTYIVEIVYGGAHTLTVPAHNGSTIRWAGGAPPTSTNTSGKIDIIQVVSDGTNVRLSMSLNY